MKITLTIAGSDSGGGAGLQADIKTMQSLNVFATCAVTCTTAQNTTGISELFNLPVTHVKNQLDKIFEDFNVSAVKIGVIGDKDNCKIIADCLKKYNVKNIILDPVMVCKNGNVFLSQETIQNVIKYLFPIALLITPNINEAKVLAKMDKIETREDIILAYNKIKTLGCKNVLIKGGHLNSDPVDMLFYKDKIWEFKKDKINTKNTHGTGCTLSSAICSYLALGKDLVESVSLAKDYVYKAIKLGCGFNTISYGPIKHHNTCEQDA